MKKIICLALILLATVSFAGCNKDEAPEKQAPHNTNNQKLIDPNQSVPN